MTSSHTSAGRIGLALALSLFAHCAHSQLPSGSAAAAADRDVGRGFREQAEEISSWGLAPEILDAVLERNAHEVLMETIRAIDLNWIYATRETARMRSLMSSPCGKKLRELVNGDPSYREAMVMDDLGALVCMSRRTSDYWQGDEAKWTRAFDEGRGAVFIAERAFDESVGAVLVQLSVPIMAEERAIGVITVGVAVSEEAERSIQ